MIPAEPLTLWTVRIALVLFAAAILSMPAGHHWRAVARWAWTLGFLWLLVHVACAFHFFHGWSHQAALADTARRTGAQIGWSFAGGLYFNYVFVALWGLDVCWWWSSPESYFRRSRVLTAGSYGFLLFIAFQSTVVFAAGPTRWIAILVSLLIAVQYARFRRQLTSNPLPSSTRLT